MALTYRLFSSMQYLSPYGDRIAMTAIAQQKHGAHRAIEAHVLVNVKISHQAMMSPNH
ncbi:MAG: hypothetical protein AAF327_04570 [Cyanobacteria bacterium P01_A01_bin.37]